MGHHRLLDYISEYVAKHGHVVEGDALPSHLQKFNFAVLIILTLALVPCDCRFAMELPYLLTVADPTFTVLTGVAANTLYFIGLVIYRLYFSPIARFPGPKIAAATGWYEFYYDYWKNGKYIFEIEKMHKKYGKCNST